MRDLFAASALQDLAGEWCLDATYHGVIEMARVNAFRLQPMAGPARPDNTMRMHAAGKNKAIAEVRIVGIMAKGKSFFADTSTAQVRDEINSAAKDPNIHGILLRIDSPGGTVNGTAELGDAIKAANKSKPVFSFVDGMAASAAYWAGSQARMMFAGNRMAQVGSIGTYMAAMDVSKAMEAAGIQTKLWTTGPLKAIGVPGVPITEEQSAHIQERVNAAQTHFDAAVRSGRMMNATQLTAVRSGEAFWAADAIDKRLIDGIKSLEQTIAALAAAA